MSDYTRLDREKQKEGAKSNEAFLVLTARELNAVAEEGHCS